MDRHRKIDRLIDRSINQSIHVIYSYVYALSISTCYIRYMCKFSILLRTPIFHAAKGGSSFGALLVPGLFVQTRKIEDCILLEDLPNLANGRSAWH